jgi:hypothetical protein
VQEPEGEKFKETREYLRRELRKAESKGASFVDVNCGSLRTVLDVFREMERRQLRSARATPPPAGDEGHVDVEALYHSMSTETLGLLVRAFELDRAREAAESVAFIDRRLALLRRELRSRRRPGARTKRATSATSGPWS